MFVTTRASDYVIKFLQKNSCVTLTAPAGVGYKSIKTKKFNLLSPFVSCECNLISDKLCLTAIEKKQIANMYIGTKSKSLNEIANRCEFFPLLCCLYHKEKDADVNEFFRNPFGVYKDELDDLSKHGDVGKHKICSLALCVLFNNQLLEKWFQGKVTNEQRRILEDTCEACSLSRSTSKAELNEALTL
ncbi:unnamed protein product [Mytilus edulis]|uniref:Uncharacterized protein n=1 Tax=Mytilus edulis TaxID=6550 RepID=A0A8S3RBK5_MYTED|nr:unnamed protein product [Mytilus edulis]